MTDAPALASNPIPAPAADAGWQSYHLFLHTDAAQVDAFLTDDLAPLLDRLVALGQAAEWFFIRYNEGGPHLRIRVRGLAGAAAAELPATLAGLASARPTVEGAWPSYHAEVRHQPYVPETERYGGPHALPIAEQIFVASSRLAVAALRSALRSALGSAGRGAADRLALAADLAHTTAFALGLDQLAAAQWLRRHAASWRWITEVPLLPGTVVHAKVNSVYAAQHEALVRRGRALRESLAAGTAAPWLTAWTEQVRAADQRLREASGELGESGAPAAEVRLPWVWASQLHMLFNRLGVTPDEERAVCRLASRTLLDAGEPPTFFPTGHRAPDRQYLERSKFQIGRTQDSALRTIPPAPATPAVPGAPRPVEVELAADPLPDLSLRAALTARTSARGPLGGPLAARELGTLLWSTHAVSHHSEQRLADGTVRPFVHRPYPSAGALYTAGLRLFVLDVDGLQTGTYQCVPERRALQRIGPVPPLDEIKALSSYLSRSAEDPDWIGIDAAPVVLGLYVNLGLLRRRYGLRALRLGLLEAGHLAQTLVLAAAALGLATTTLAGIHDDLAHELFGLDDLDQPLQYLLPLGRRPGRP